MFLKKLTVGDMIGTNCYLVGADETDECVVIDPGAEADRILKAAGNRRIYAILLTHGHFDHIGAVGELLRPDTELYMHALDAPFLTDGSKNGSRALIGRDVTVDAGYKCVREGDELPLAGLKFRVLHTPGHTQGSVCYRVGDSLFSGDTMFDNGWGRTDLYGGSEAEIMRSLRRLLPVRDACTLYPGHDTL